MKFPPNLLKTEEAKRKLLVLIRTYFDRGGYHIQFNMINKETLLDAKAHPENYRDLVVRIAGFSAYFVDLIPAVQDDIIARTELSL
jgi:pyruvate-formate lyase